jgi:hypothetical protein
MMLLQMIAMMINRQHDDCGKYRPILLNWERLVRASIKKKPDHDHPLARQ